MKKKWVLLKRSMLLLKRRMLSCQLNWQELQKESTSGTMTEAAFLQARLDKLEEEKTAWATTQEELLHNAQAENSKVKKCSSGCETNPRQAAGITSKGSPSCNFPIEWYRRRCTKKIADDLQENLGKQTENKSSERALAKKSRGTPSPI